MVVKRISKQGPLFVGAMIGKGGVAHVHQSPSTPLLDEDEFHAKTGLRLSFPARVAVQRLLQEDVLLLDVRDLIQSGELIFADSKLLLTGKGESAQRISGVLDAVNLDMERALKRAVDAVQRS